MSRQRSSTRRRKPKRTGSPTADPDLREDRAADAVTIAWTVSVTMVLLADIVTIVAHFYLRSHPDAKPAAAFEAIMLLTASLIGAVSLALLPIVWRVRRVKPPQGYLVFAVLVAAAPIIATVARLVR